MVPLPHPEPVFHQSVAVASGWMYGSFHPEAQIQNALNMICVNLTNNGSGTIAIEKECLLLSRSTI